MGDNRTMYYKPVFFFCCVHNHKNKLSLVYFRQSFPLDKGEEETRIFNLFTRFFIQLQQTVVDYFYTTICFYMRLCSRGEGGGGESQTNIHFHLTVSTTKGVAHKTHLLFIMHSIPFAKAKREKRLLKRKKNSFLHQTTRNIEKVNETVFTPLTFFFLRV